MEQSKSVNNFALIYRAERVRGTREPTTRVGKRKRCATLCVQMEKLLNTRCRKESAPQGACVISIFSFGEHAVTLLIHLWNCASPLAAAEMGATGGFSLTSFLLNETIKSSIHTPCRSYPFWTSHFNKLPLKLKTKAGCPFLRDPLLK